MKFVSRKTIVLAVLLFAVGCAYGFSVSKIAKGQVASDYTWEYDNQNFYREYGLTYYMDNLTVGADYEWEFALVDSDGLVIDVVATRSLEFTGATTAFGTAYPIHINSYEWPEDTFSAVKVSDNYGNILSFHYLAPSPGDEWVLSNGNTAENNKQSTGSRRSTTGGCKAPPYNDTLLNGWHHTARSCSVAVTPGGYTLLHYRMDISDYGNGETINMHYVNPETLDVSEFELDELVDFQTTGRGSVLPARGGQSSNNFVLLNTSGESADLPPIDGQARLAFSTGDDPMEDSLPVGAYACTREDSGGSWISDCESILLVSSAPNGNEWGFSFQNSEVATHETGTDPNTQTANFQLSTSQIWDAYNGAWIFGDSEVGTVDTSVYGFSTEFSTTYDVDVLPANAGNVVTGDWRVFPASLPTDLATTSEMYFEGVNRSTNQEPTYILTASDEFAAGIRVLLERTGFDSPSGQIIFFLLTVLVGSGLMWYAKAWGVTFPPILHSFWYLGSGSIIIATGLATGLFVILFVITAPLVMLYGIVLQRNRGDSFA